jgi:hypothetical protein
MSLNSRATSFFASSISLRVPVRWKSHADAPRMNLSRASSPALMRSVPSVLNSSSSRFDDLVEGRSLARLFDGDAAFDQLLAQVSPSLDCFAIAANARGANALLLDRLFGGGLLVLRESLRLLAASVATRALQRRRPFRRLVQWPARLGGGLVFVVGHGFCLLTSDEFTRVEIVGLRAGNGASIGTDRDHRELVRLPVFGAIHGRLVLAVLDLDHLVDAVADGDVAQDALAHLAERLFAFGAAVEADGRGAARLLELRALDHADHIGQVVALVRVEQRRLAAAQAVHADVLRIERELLVVRLPETALHARAGRPRDIDRSLLGVDRGRHHLGAELQPRHVPGDRFVGGGCHLEPVNRSAYRGRFTRRRRTAALLRERRSSSEDGVCFRGQRPAACCCWPRPSCADRCRG